MKSTPYTKPVRLPIIKPQSKIPSPHNLQESSAKVNSTPGVRGAGGQPPLPHRDTPKSRAYLRGDTKTAQLEESEKEKAVAAAQKDPQRQGK